MRRRRGRCAGGDVVVHAVRRPRSRCGVRAAAWRGPTPYRSAPRAALDQVASRSHGTCSAAAPATTWRGEEPWSDRSFRSSSPGSGLQCQSWTCGRDRRPRDVLAVRRCGRVRARCRCRRRGLVRTGPARTSNPEARPRTDRRDAAARGGPHDGGAVGWLPAGGRGRIRRSGDRRTTRPGAHRRRGGGRRRRRTGPSLVRPRGRAGGPTTGASPHRGDDAWDVTVARSGARGRRCARRRPMGRRGPRPIAGRPGRCAAGTVLPACVRAGRGRADHRDVGSAAALMPHR
ncbi:hypothetical protein SAMN04515669_6399 [Jiangella sp. DSM 45060]|nr:hypothetical protein SAMN04515669_6399 [Jiangella sp. DSM 45060]